MKKYEVLVADRADQDLREIFEYIAFELLSYDNAVRQLERIEAAIERLDTFPEGYRLYEDEHWNRRNLRVLPVDNYVVFYIPDNDNLTVTIIRVIYGGRNIKEQLNRFTKYDE